MDLPRALPKLRTERGLERRISALRRRYEPWLRNLPGPRCSLPRGEDVTRWRFRYADEADWQEVTVPEYRGDGYWEGEYRTKLRLDGNVAAMPRVALRFNGVDTIATVSVNGEQVGSHRGACAPFVFDVTECVDRDGENDVRVHVRNGVSPNAAGPSPDEGTLTLAGWPRTLPGQFYKLTGEWGNMHGRKGYQGGIWRHVHAVGRADQWIEDALIHPHPEEERIEARVELGAARAAEVECRLQILPKNFREPGAREPVTCKLRLHPGTTEEALQLPIPDGRRWTPERPALYSLRVELVRDGRLLHRRHFTFGLRTFVYDPGRQIHVFNGVPFRFRGTSTINSLNMAYVRKDEESIIRQILLAKAAGFNAMRHHILSPIAEIDEYFDALGMPAQPEMPIWQNFHPELVEVALEQLPQLVRQHINHPSTVMFALSSECWRGGEAYEEYRDRAIALMEERFPWLVWKVEGQSWTEDSERIVARERILDRHEYPGWYGSLGQLPPTRERRYPMTAGEFGPEALSNLSTIQSRWPADEYPADPDAPAALEELPHGQYKAGCVAHFLPYPQTLREWIEATQRHQARVLRYQGSLYRRSPCCIGYHQYFLNEPVPNQWRKTLCGVDLSPKPGYFVMAELNAEHFVSVFSETDHTAPGCDADCRVDVANDGTADVEHSVVTCTVLDPDGREVAGEQWENVEVSAGGPRLVGRFTITPTAGWKSGRYRVRAFWLSSSGDVLADTEWRFRHLGPDRFPMLDAPRPAGAGLIVAAEPFRRVAESLADASEGWRVVEADVLREEATLAEADAVLLLGAVASDRASAVRGYVHGGGSVLVVEPSRGEIPWLDPEVEVVEAPPTGLCRIEADHRLFRGLTQDDFFLWSYVRTGRGSPGERRTRDVVAENAVAVGDRQLVGSEFTTEQGTRIVPLAYSEPTRAAVLTAGKGKGRCVLTTVSCLPRYETHPVARLFLHRLVAEATQHRG